MKKFRSALKSFFATPLRRWLVRGAAVAVAIWLILWVLAPLLVELPSGLDESPVPGAEIVDRNGKPLRKMLNPEGQRTEPSLPLDGVPRGLINATLAAEDQRFWEHSGIDFVALVRAINDGIDAGRPVSGASTISQQLIKISGPRRERKVSTKLFEFVAARKLEMVWSKERILSTYFSRLDYGNLLVGAPAAAQGYFGKPLADCSLAECALLAGLPQAPSRLNPYRAFDRAKERQEWILNRMVDEKMISAEQAEEAKREQLVLAKDFGAFRAPHFVDQIIAAQESEADLPAVFQTTLDLDLQTFAERTVSQHLQRLRTHNVTNAAVVVIDNASGDVITLIGSANYRSRRGGQNNGATAPRSPGSTLKPFTYLIALERGDTPATIVDDIPVEFMTGTGIYAPVNYDHRNHGPVSYRRALGNSLNISAVRALDRVGGARVLMNALAACGVTTLTEAAEHYGLGLTIGNAEVCLLELTNAYACLARLGNYLPWRLQLDSTPPGLKRVFEEDATYLIADMLSDPSARAAAFGADSLLNLAFPVACKTGTSSDYRDNWTIGFTPGVTVGVWAGNFGGEPMQNVSGISGAGPIFRDIMEHCHKTIGLTWYTQPPTIVERSVDPATGLPPAHGQPLPRQKVREKFREWNVPRPDPSRYDALGRVRLSTNYARWFNSPENWLGETAVLANESGKAPMGTLRILSPLPGTVVYLDPDFPDRGARFPLSASGVTGELQWTSKTLRVSDQHAILTEGTHHISARNPTTGTTLKTWVEVRSL